MRYVFVFSALLCLLLLPTYARTIPLLWIVSGRVINVRSARVRDYLSPDGKYVAHIAPQYGEGGEEVPSLTILVRSSGRRTRSVSNQWATVTNFVWLPHHPHSLAVALNSDGDFTGALLLWQAPGQTGTVTLRQGRDTDDDDFSIEAVSADGRSLTYKRYGYDAPVPADLKGAKRHRLNLPH